MSDDGSEDLTVEQTIANTFHAINAVLSRPMANYHRSAFRSLITHTTQSVLNTTSHSHAGVDLFYHDAIAQDVIALFLPAYADMTWPEDYSGDYYLSDEDKGEKLRLRLVWYVINVLEAGGFGNTGDKTPETLIQQLKRRLQEDDFPKRREVRQTQSLEDLRNVGRHGSWIFDARCDVVFQRTWARRIWEEEEEESDESREQRREERHAQSDGHLSISSNEEEVDDIELALLAVGVLS